MTEVERPIETPENPDARGKSGAQSAERAARGGDGEAVPGTSSESETEASTPEGAASGGAAEPAAESEPAGDAEASAAGGAQDEAGRDERAAASEASEGLGADAGAGTGAAAATAEVGAEVSELAEEVAGGTRRRRIAVLLGVALLAYVLDLVTKILVVAELEHHQPIEVVGTLLRLDVIRNPGAAFGLGEALTIGLSLIAAVVVVVIVRIARKLYSTPWAIALGLLLGGACGNLTDRIFRSPGVFRGAVVDFIAPSHFAVFNLADSAIVCGGVLIVLLSFRGLDPDGTVHRD